MLALALIAIVCVSVLIFPVIDKVLKDPLSRLTNGIQRIARGHYKNKLPAQPQLELSRISEEFNVMAEEISNRENQIRKSMEVATLLKTELSMAATIQKSMTSSSGLLREHRLAQYYQPVNNLSGDWMTVIECDKGRTMYALVGDVTGHGVPQGLVTMAALGAVQTLKPLIQQNSQSFAPSVILNILRSTLASILHDCKLAMTVNVIKIDLPSRRLSISNAGHPFPFVIRGNGKENLVKPITAPPQSPLGFEFLSLEHTPDPYEDHHFELVANDLVCLFSDGLTEATGNNKQMFRKSFVKILKSVDLSLSANEILKHVLSSFNRHLEGGKCGDDVCLVMIDTKRRAKNEIAA
jgi:serine phosphatase RsbU (regulator of sigma subunit)